MRIRWTDTYIEEVKTIDFIEATETTENDEKKTTWFLNVDCDYVGKIKDGAFPTEMALRNWIRDVLDHTMRHGYFDARGTEYILEIY